MGKTVSFLGESVANGFLFAPNFTPALCLQECLNKYPEDYTVIDRSKVSIRMKELLEVSHDQNVAGSDLAVFFAGNNWRKDIWDEDEIFWKKIADEAKSEKDYGEVFKQKYIEWCNKKVSDFFDDIEDKYLSQNKPVIFVIPECNIKDWAYGEYECTVNWPTRDHRIESIKEKLLSLDKYDASGINLAKELVDKAPSNPCGYQWLANYYYENKEYSKAYKYYVEALDTNIYRIGPPPAINSYIREAIMENSKRKGLIILDLREKLNDIEHGAIAGNNYFVDYCHLNVEGMNKVCNMLARVITEICGEEYQHDDLSISPDSEVTSHAYYYAAIHSAHSGNIQKNYMYYLLSKAVEANNKILEKIKSYVYLASMKLPWRINRFYLDIYSPQYPLMRQPRDCMVMDVELTSVMIDILKENGIDISNSIFRERVLFHGLRDNRRVNLLETYYRENSYFNTFIGSKSIDFDAPKISYGRFRTKVSKFHFVSECNSDVDVKVMLRLPNETVGHIVSFYCNNELICSMKINKDWTLEAFSIDKSLLGKDGLNELEIKWPAIKNVVNHENKECSYYSTFLDITRPIYGEIGSFILSRE